MNEYLLGAWLKLSAVIWNNRIVDGNVMSYNETLICGLIRKRVEVDEKYPYITIKALRDRTNMSKSQINKILNDLEKKGYIERYRFKDDRRLVYITLSKQGVEAYDKEHEKISEFVNSVVDRLGKEKTVNAIKAFDNVAKAVDEVLKE